MPEKGRNTIRGHAPPFGAVVLGLDMVTYEATLNQSINVGVDGVVVFVFVVAGAVRTIFSRTLGGPIVLSRSDPHAVATDDHNTNFPLLLSQGLSSAQLSRVNRRGKKLPSSDPRTRRVQMMSSMSQYDM